MVDGLGTDFVGHVGAVAIAVALPFSGQAGAVAAAVLRRLARVRGQFLAVALVRAAVAVGIAVAHPLLRDAVAVVAAERRLRAVVPHPCIRQNVSISFPSHQLIIDSTHLIIFWVFFC